MCKKFLGQNIFWFTITEQFFHGQKSFERLLPEKNILYPNFKGQQAGAELCQAQYRLELAMFLFGSVASLKFDCLVKTGLVAIVNNQILPLD